MKRSACLLSAVLGVLVLAGSAKASWGTLSYGGYQPWWNIFAHRTCMSAEEERLQHFWHDYYDAMKHYYDSLDNMDWVAYYKNHGYQINAGAGCYGAAGGSQRIQYAPVFVSPTMQWAVPNSCLNGAPVGAPMCAPASYQPASYQPVSYQPTAYYPPGR